MSRRPYTLRGDVLYGWRDQCPHVVECSSEEECNNRSASDAAPTSDTNTAKEQDTMPSKTKKTPLQKINEARDAVSAATAGAPEGAYPSDEHWVLVERQRAAERAMVAEVGRAVLSLASERAKTERAERFNHYADALLKLRSCGAFPAIEQLQSTALHELTELSRELHAERVAARSDVKPAAPEVKPS